jgi:hypothetical protein
MVERHIRVILIHLRTYHLSELCTKTHLTPDQRAPRYNKPARLVPVFAYGCIPPHIIHSAITLFKDLRVTSKSHMASDSPRLGATFARGWRSLPTELKLEIFSYIIPRRKTLAVSFVWHSIRPVKEPQPRKVESNEHYWMSCLIISNPDYTAVALDLLFANNTLEITPGDFTLLLKINLSKTPLSTFTSSFSRPRITGLR